MQEARNNMANFPQEGGSTDWKLLSFFVKTRHRYALGLICILIRYFFGILRYQRRVKFVYRHSLIYAVNVGYGITGCGVFKAGIQNWKGFCIKINCSQMKLLNFENWTNGEPQ